MNQSPTSEAVIVYSNDIQFFSKDDESMETKGWKKKYFCIGVLVVVIIGAIAILLGFNIIPVKNDGSSGSDDDRSDDGIFTNAAALTYYDSYPKCCPNSPNYDPTADKSECNDYSGCSYLGDFSSIGQQSYSYVQR